jgi:2-polyprenyl-3-methyl-5-hydroxy-6-metoxy-1,4-benzoquinol methylase
VTAEMLARATQPAAADASPVVLCPNCRDQRTTVRYDFGRHRIVRCAGCGLLRLDPLPSEEDTLAVYGENYFQNDDFLRGDNDGLFGYADYIAERFNKQPQYAQIAKDIAARLGITGRRPKLLEVGCGFGYFLDVAFEENFDVVGLEFNATAVARLRRKYAFPILSGSLESTQLERDSFDAVVMFDVIEHLRNPFSALDRVRAAVAPGGLFVLSTVDAESTVSRLLGRRLEDFRRTREHLFFFGRKTLAQVLSAHGFETVSIRSIGHTFELAFLLERLALYNRPIFQTLRRLVTRLGLGSLQIHVNPGTKMIAFARRAG